YVGQICQVMIGMTKSRQVTTRKRLLGFQDIHNSGSNSSSNDGDPPAQRPRRVVRPAQPDAVPKLPIATQRGDIPYAQKAKEATGSGGAAAGYDGSARN
ncbi:hypothetical protein BGZ65_009372, partial [Modicella reniformis]